MKKKIYKTTIIAACLLFAIQQLYAQVPDSLFGTNSLLIVNDGSEQTVSKLLRQADGKIICAGYDSDIGFHNDMVRFDACGGIDSTFGTNGLVHHNFDSTNSQYRNFAIGYALQADEKILAAGEEAASNAGSDELPFVCRYHTNGSADTTFNHTGTNRLLWPAPGNTGQFATVIPMPDSRIICTGASFPNIGGGAWGMGVMRFMADGSLDATFDADGKALYVSSTGGGYFGGTGFLLQNGNIIAAGYYNDCPGCLGTSYMTAVAYDSTGTIVPTFGTLGVFTDNISIKGPVAAAIQPDEKIVLASSNNVDFILKILRITTAGTPDATFGTNGHLIINTTATSELHSCKGVTILSTGKILLTGRYNVAGAWGYLMRLKSDGVVDSTFGSNGLVVVDLSNGGYGYFSTALELPNGQIMAAGYDNSDFGIKRFIDQSNVPHISGNGAQLQTTGTGTYQWYLTGTLIPSATSATYMATQNGTYTVQITDALGCSYLSDSFVVTAVGIKEISNSAIKFYPDPATNQLTINLGGLQVEQINIYNVDGKLVSQTKQPVGNRIDISGLAKGVYVAEVNLPAGQAGVGEAVQRVRWVKM